MVFTKTGQISTNKRKLADYKQINACIPNRLLKALQLICLDKEIDLTQGVTEAIAQYVSQNIDSII